MTQFWPKLFYLDDLSGNVKRKVKRKDWERDQELIRRMGREGKTVILELKEWLSFISESQWQLLELRRLHRSNASSETLAAISDGAWPVSGRLWGKLFLACSAMVKRTETPGVKPCSCSLNWARPRSRHSIRGMLTAQPLNNQPTSLQYLWHIPSLLIASSPHPFTLLVWSRFLFLN